MGDLGDVGGETELLIGTDCFGQLLTERKDYHSNGLTILEANIGPTLLKSNQDKTYTELIM